MNAPSFSSTSPRESDGTNDKGRAMRIKRHKAVRKTLKFFQVNFGFRQPYKVSSPSTPSRPSECFFFFWGGCFAFLSRFDSFNWFQLGANTSLCFLVYRFSSTVTSFMRCSRLETGTSKARFQSCSWEASGLSQHVTRSTSCKAWAANTKVGFFLLSSRDF